MTISVLDSTVLHPGSFSLSYLPHPASVSSRRGKASGHLLQADLALARKRTRSTGRVDRGASYVVIEHPA